MTPQQFRKLALSQPDAIESEHMQHPDFRIGGKIFASLGKPSDGWAMVKLTPEQQKAFCDSDTSAFRPCKGAWGRQGYTNVQLVEAKPSVVRSALNLAVENIANASSSKVLSAKASSGKRSHKTAKPVTATKIKAPEFSDSDAVTAKLSDLDHPLKEVIQDIRATILKSDPRITEGIKWNSPSFYCDGWFATFHLRAKEGVLLVLHHGAKVRELDSVNATVSDPTGLLTWPARDRATVTFLDANDFKRKKAAFKSIVKQWVTV